MSKYSLEFLVHKVKKDILLFYLKVWSSLNGGKRGMGHLGQGSMSQSHSACLCISLYYLDQVCTLFLGFPGGSVVKESAYQCRNCRRHGFDPWVRKVLWSRTYQPTSVFLPEKFHEQRSLTSYSPWDCKESDMTECAHTQA